MALFSDSCARVPRLSAAFRVAAAPSVALVLLVCGCQSRVSSALALASLNAECRLNSDCEAQLICAFEHCHEACVTSRDCSEGLRCVESSTPRHVCELERERLCSPSAACPGLQICGRDGQCRDACTSDRDCVAEQICAGSTCADTSELTAQGGLPSGDAANVAPAPCVFNSDCTGDLRCISGSCLVECRTDADCPAGRSCRGGSCDLDLPPAAECSYNSDCPLNQACRAGQCQPSQAPTRDCAYASECPKLGQRCVSGECRCQCSVDSECPTDQTCQDACACVPGKVLLGDVYVSNVNQLSELEQVIEITGTLSIDIATLAALESHLSALRKVGGLDLGYGGYPIPNNAGGPNTFVFESLREARKISLQNSRATAVILPALEHTDELVIAWAPKLTSLSIPLLSRVRVLDVSGVPNLSTFSANLVDAESVTFRSNDTLTTISLPRLKPSLPVDATVEHNPLLASIDLPGVTHAGSLRFVQNPVLRTLGLASLTQVGSLLFDQSALSSLDSLAALVSAGDLQFTNNAHLPTCAVQTLGARISTAMLTDQGNQSCVCSGAVCQ